jgi:hypothetical protein
MDFSNSMRKYCFKRIAMIHILRVDVWLQTHMFTVIRYDAGTYCVSKLQNTAIRNFLLSHLK